MMTQKITRRDFLKSAAAGAGIILTHSLFTACGLNQDTPAPSLVSTDTPVSLDRTIPQPESTASAAEAVPHLAVARHGEPEALVRGAIAALGGMKRFVSSGNTVVIKPNICTAYHTYEYASTTNPWVVATLVTLCLEAGAAHVQVLDYPFGGTPDEAYTRSGIAEQVKAVGGEMLLMPRFKFLASEIPAGQSLHQASIFEDALKADVLINVPIAKHHSLARLTLGMKNLMGLILERQAIHQDLGQRLADLTSRIRPTLTVVDAVRILMNHGPTGGDLNDVKKIDTIIASPDIIAADSYAATLFGLKPDQLAYIQAGVNMGLGRSDLENLVIEEISIGA